MTTTKTPIELDDEALAAAAEVLGTRTKKDTVNTALREVSARLGRLRALEELGAMADRGDFDASHRRPGEPAVAPRPLPATEQAMGCRYPSKSGAGDENRTRVASLEDWGSTIELRPRGCWGPVVSSPLNGACHGGNRRSVSLMPAPGSL